MGQEVAWETSEVLELPEHEVMSCPSFRHQFPSEKISLPVSCHLLVPLRIRPVHQMLGACEASLRCSCPLLSTSVAHQPLLSAFSPVGVLPVLFMVCTEFPGCKLSSGASCLVPSYIWLANKYFNEHLLWASKWVSGRVLSGEYWLGTGTVRQERGWESDLGVSGEETSL